MSRRPGESLLAPNLGNSPSSVAFNLRVSRSFGIGPKVESQLAGGRGQRGQGGGPGFGGPGGSAADPAVVAAVAVAAAAVVGGMFGGGGGGRGGMSNTGRKYSLTFSAQALNLFNDINYGTPNGSVVPTLVPGHRRKRLRPRKPLR